MLVHCPEAFYFFSPSAWEYWLRRLTRGLATLRKGIQEPLVVKRQDGRPQEDPLAVHCFCVCSGSALLGDLLGVSRSMERDLLSVLSIYPRIFLHVFIACIASLIRGYLLHCCILLYVHVC